jgi:hypothetical protein
MHGRPELLRNVIISVAIVIVILPLVWFADYFGKLSLIGVVGGVGVIVGAYIGVRHPLWLFWILAFILAGLPFGRFPGISLPLYLPFAFGAVVATFFHPRFARSTHPLEFALLALFFTSLFSVLVTGQSLADASIFIRWGIATLLMLALSRLQPEHLARFGKIFAVVATVNGAYGIFLMFFDPNNTTLGYLKVFGYLPQYLIARFAFAGETSLSIRLGGTWVEPNGAGLNLALALALSILLFTGWRRLLLAAVLSVALILTLSRASIFTIVAGVVLVLVFHPMHARARLATIGVMTVIAGGALTAEPVRRRFLSSFGAGDAGSAARADALTVFPGQMSGHWAVGWGWARREFYDSAYAYVFNLPSNATLITLYRGGILPFIAFVVLAIMGCVYGYRALRGNSLPRAIYGGTFIGLVVVQMQLDHPLADTPGGAITYSIFLAFLVYTDRARREEKKLDALEADAVPPKAPPPTTAAPPTEPISVSH